MSRIWTALKILWTLFALTALSAAIWFGLPALGVEELARIDVRAGLVAGVLIVFGFTLAIRRFTRRRSARALEEKLTAGQKGDARILAERMSEAVARLKASKGTASLYTLPWYVLIGPPGAGKTTALVHSGLAFPGSKPESVSGMGGTRNCDFWFSDDAVLIDTAGRYTTQDSDHQSDAASWAAFLSELKTARSKQPINGVLLAFSCEDMMRGDARMLAAHASAVRARLAELNSVLRVRVPVYAVFTKADLVSGFRAYFGRLGAGARKSVWGVTFQSKDPTKDAQAEVGTEFDRLVARLGDQIPARMMGEKDTQTRHMLMRFPEQMGALKGNLELFLRLIFQGEGAQGAMLRGYYFTSGTQEGTPFDQILGGVARGGPEVEGFMSGRGRSYFLHDLLRGVVIPERGWVGHDRRRMMLRGAVRGLSLGVVGLGALAAMALLAQSFWSNASLVRAADRQSALYAQAAAPFLAQEVVTGPSVREVLGPLALVRDMPGGYLDPSPQGWQQDLGLSRRDSVRQSALATYSEALERLLRPRMMITLEDDLAAILTRQDHRIGFEALRVYLLVAGAQPGAGDDLAVQTYFARAWADEFAGDDAGYRTALGHLAALLDLDARAKPLVTASAPLVEALRAMLLALTPEEIVLAAVQGQGGALPAVRPFDGIGAESGLRVSDGRSLGTVEIAPLLTLDGYSKVMAAVIEDAQGVLTREAWVLGVAATETADISAEVARFYASEVSAAWAGALGRLEPVPDAGEALGPAGRAALSAVAAGLDWPDNTLKINENFSPDSLTDARLGQVERGLAAMGVAADFDAVVEAEAIVGLAPDDPQILRAFVDTVAGSVRADLVRGEVVGVVRACQALAQGRYPFGPQGTPPLPVVDFAALVGSNGELAGLARAHEARKGIGGALPGPVRDLIAKGAALEAAFMDGAGEPRLIVNASLVAASQSVEALRLSAGAVEYSLGLGDEPQEIAWPWDGDLSLEPVPRYQDVPEELRFAGGPWGMISLLDPKLPARQAGGIIEVTHPLGNRVATLRLDFGAPAIPFQRPELTTLRCPRLRQ